MLSTYGDRHSALGLLVTDTKVEAWLYSNSVIVMSVPINFYDDAPTPCPHLGKDAGMPLYPPCTASRRLVLGVHVPRSQSCLLLVFDVQEEGSGVLHGPEERS